MNLQGLSEHSPLRLFDSAIQGGLGRGNMGVVIARHGAGKTPFVVHVALDALFRGRRVLHVSLDMKTEHVREFYDQIFAELARAAQLDDTASAHLDIERLRRIHAYLGQSFTLDKLASAVSFMREHADFTPDVLVVDEFDFAHTSVEELERLIRIADEAGAELWATAVRHREDPITDGDGVAPPVAEYKQWAKVIVDLQTDNGKVRIRLLKPASDTRANLLPLTLDPTTMLITGG